MIHLNFYPYDLKFTEVFEVSSNARTATELIIVELTANGIKGYGQASYPPYLKARRQEDMRFLASLDLTRLGETPLLNDVLELMDRTEGHMPAKAAVDMAMYDLMGKAKGVPLLRILELDQTHRVYSSFTIGIGKDDFIKRQLVKAAQFRSLKIKLSGDMAYNKHLIGLIRSETELPIGVDFNEGLKDKDTALYMLNWLSEKNVQYAEQPMPVALESDYKWLRANSPVDIFGDESIQDLKDIMEKKDLFHGVNIKLMKCGGISKALDMAVAARSLGLKLMIGCMAESVCAVTAAANIAGMFDRVDLDGHLMNANDPFTGISLEGGLVEIPKLPGLGIKKIF